MYVLLARLKEFDKVLLGASTERCNKVLTFPDLTGFDSCAVVLALSSSLPHCVAAGD